MNVWKSCARWMLVGSLAVAVLAGGLARPAQANISSWSGYWFGLNLDDDHAPDMSVAVGGYNTSTSAYNATIYRAGQSPVTISNLKITPGVGGMRYKFSFSEGSVFSSKSYTGAVREFSNLYEVYVAGTMVQSGYIYQNGAFVHYTQDPLPFCGNGSIPPK